MEHLAGDIYEQYTLLGEETIHPLGANFGQLAGDIKKQYTN
jgi:hypothetical protein